MRNLTISTKFFEDERIIAISGEFGIAGELCALKLLCEIRKNGYYLKWDTLKQNFLARTFGVDPDTLRAIVDRLAEYGFFSLHALRMYKVLTTEELQRKYFRPKSRRRDIGGIPYLIVTLEPAEPEDTSQSPDNSLIKADDAVGEQRPETTTHNADARETRPSIVGKGQKHSRVVAGFPMPGKFRR